MLKSESQLRIAKFKYNVTNTFQEPSVLKHDIFSDFFGLFRHFEIYSVFFRRPSSAFESISAWNDFLEWSHRLLHLLSSSYSLTKSVRGRDRSCYNSVIVWPDFGIKVAQNISNSCPMSGRSSFTEAIMFVKRAPKELLILF